MIEIPVHNEAGAKIGTESLDADLLGGEVNHALLKQAAVMYHANRRQGHAVNRSRGQVHGSTRKLYKQKGTGHARRGPVRTPVMEGGGRAFAKAVREHRHLMPRSMRRLARNNAILAKILGEGCCIVEVAAFDKPRTKRFAQMLTALNAANGCTFATAGLEPVLYRSGRNIPRTNVLSVAELNAEHVLTRKKLVFTRAAFAAFRESLTGGAAD